MASRLLAHLQILVLPEVLTKIRRIAKKENKSLAAVVRELIDAGLAAR